MVNGGFGWRFTNMSKAPTCPSIQRLSTAALGPCSCILTENTISEFAHVVQYVMVEPDTRYRFVAYARSEGITTDSGPRITVYDAYDRTALAVATEGVIATTSWQEQNLEFRTGPRTKLLVVQVTRPTSRKLDNQIAGSLWLDDLSLTAIP